MSSAAVTTTSPSIMEHASNTVTVRAKMGTPSNSINCFLTAVPIRLPVPAAGTTAQTLPALCVICIMGCLLSGQFCGGRGFCEYYIIGLCYSAIGLVNRCPLRYDIVRKGVRYEIHTTTAPLGALFLDGAMDIRLMEMGMAPFAHPEMMNLVHPEWVYNVHREYLEAGADILRTNTFGVNGWKCSDVKYQQIIREGIQIARRAAAHASTEEKPRYVAFDIGPSGAKPMEEAIPSFAEMVQIAEEEGANVIFLDSFQELYEMKAAVLAAKENTSLPIFVTMAQSLERDPACFAALMEGLRVDALGLQGGTNPNDILPLVRELAGRCSIPIIATPNRRLHSPAEEFALDMRELMEAGAHLGGGSGGTTPAHIRCMAKRCDSLHPAVIQQEEITVASSYAIAQRIGGGDSGSLMVGSESTPRARGGFSRPCKIMTGAMYSGRRWHRESLCAALGCQCGNAGHR